MTAPSCDSDDSSNPANPRHDAPSVLQRLHGERDKIQVAGGRTESGVGQQVEEPQGDAGRMVSASPHA